MKLRIALATGALGLAVVTLSGCGSSDPTEPSSPTSPTSETSTTAPTPSATSPTDGAAALVGDWEIPAEDYVLHLKDDGSFVQDYKGLKDFRTGTYTVEGDTISLVGGDGDTDEGTIKGDTLVFVLGTATRVM